METLREAGLWSEAIDELQRLRTRGELERASSRLLAELLLAAPGELRDPALALTIVEEIDADAKGGDLAALELLAAAQAANGRAAEAVRTQERALLGWRARGDAAALERAAARLLDYQRAAAPVGSPWELDITSIPGPCARTQPETPICLASATGDACSTSPFP